MNDHVMGCDAHLDTLEIAVVDSVGREVFTGKFPNTVSGWREIVRVGRGWETDRIGIEGASGYGMAAAKHLTQSGFEIVEIPTRLTSRLRIREGGSKSDPGDARTIAKATAAGHGSRWRYDPTREALRVVVHRREALVRTQTREINTIRALLREVDPQRSATNSRIRSARSLKALTQANYHGDQHRNQIAALIRQTASECLRRQHTITQLQKRISELLPPAGKQLCEQIMGISTITAGLLIAELAGTDGFQTQAQFGS